jgi:heme-degrading monooxygenase HmoA
MAEAMILESVVLNVKEGQDAEFEAAARKASPILARQKGHRAHRFQKCLEAEGRYLLLVWWDRLEDHTEGFRKSSDYDVWRKLLHHFYDRFPEVEHYTPLVREGRVPDD